MRFVILAAVRTELAPSTQPQPYQQHPDWVAKLGGWLFTWRTFLPQPIILALIIIPSSTTSLLWFWLGAACVASGEILRLWAVRQIGVISRTRSQRLGPLVARGPFAVVRNPLYLGNLAIWIGFTLSARLPWLAPIVAALLACAYHAIVRWEEELLASRLGDSYRSYVARVPGWVPRLSSARALDETDAQSFPWRETLFSERGTLMAIAFGYVLLWLKPLM